jgi:hypothetical protein
LSVCFVSFRGKEQTGSPRVIANVSEWRDSYFSMI